MLLATDGSIMAEGPGVSNQWFKLTPGTNGGYASTGTWSNLASMSLQRLYFGSNVLKDGRVLVVGGEYSGPSGTSNWTNTGEIYNPVANSWSGIANFPQSQFGDDPTMLLDDGRVLAGYLSGPQTYLYDPSTNTWTAAGTKLRNERSDEETWLKLADGSILSYDVFSSINTGVGSAQRYIPSTNTWVDAGTVPVALSSSALGEELGGAALLADGRAWYIGATGHTALYDPATNSWTAGPDIPNGQHADDAPACMMPNGHVLFAADGSSTSSTFSPPTHIYEYDPVAGTITQVPDPVNLSGTPSYECRMLMLPDGRVAFTDGSAQLFVYTPDSGPNAAWKPTISGIVPNGNNYTLTGTQLNGISAGTSYGDDANMDSNYPIIELINASGTVYFARTFNWSSTGVATGNTPVSTDFSLPAGIPNGAYSLYVVANGIASDPFAFSVNVVNQGPDLAVTNPNPASSTEGSNITFTLQVTNTGSTTNATGTVLTDTLGANLKYVSATKTQGSFKVSGSKITFTIGTVGPGQTVTATVTAQSTEDGSLTDTAVVTSNNDSNSSNNSATATAVVTEPPITFVLGPTITVTSNGKKGTNATVATFTHANGAEPASAFTATINWGDNTTSTGTITKSGTTYTVKGSHSYAKAGSYTVTTTVTEAGSPPNNAAVAASLGLSLAPSGTDIPVLPAQGAAASRPANVDFAPSSADASTVASDLYFSQDAQQSADSGDGPLDGTSIFDLAVDLVSALPT